jgi:hypothetical protein
VAAGVSSSTTGTTTTITITRGMAVVGVVGAGVAGVAGLVEGGGELVAEVVVAVVVAEVGHHGDCATEEHAAGQIVMVLHTHGEVGGVEAMYSM